MSETTTAHNDWVKNVLGFDISGGGEMGEVAEDGLDEVGGGKAQKRAKGGGDKDIASGKDGGKGGKASSTALPADKVLAASLKALSDEAAALKKIGFNTKQTMADHADLAKRGVAAEKLTEPDRTKQIDEIKKRASEEVEHARSLSKSVKKIMGDKKGNPNGSQKSAIYKGAIEDLYGLKITVPPGMKNTHFDKVFDMFGTVPKGDVKQDKLKSLTYSNKRADRGGGAYGSNDIEMGDFGGARGKETYEIDGKKIPANSFNITTLHEVGHAVDEKHGIMTKNGAKGGCGGWKRESVRSTTAAFLPELKKAVTVAPEVTDAVLTAAIRAALKAGTTAQPDGVATEAWKPILKYLVGHCLKVRSDADPWFASSQIVVGGRVYQEAYAAEWWSYDNGARASTKVNNYQWRSPAEWFAEVYAISWLSKKRAPTGVDASVVPYMYKG